MDPGGRLFEAGGPPPIAKLWPGRIGNDAERVGHQADLWPRHRRALVGCRHDRGRAKGPGHVLPAGDTGPRQGPGHRIALAAQRRPAIPQRQRRCRLGHDRRPGKRPADRNTGGPPETALGLALREVRCRTVRHLPRQRVHGRLLDRPRRLQADDATKTGTGRPGQVAPRKPQAPNSGPGDRLHHPGGTPGGIGGMERRHGLRTRRQGVAPDRPLRQHPRQARSVGPEVRHLQPIQGRFLAIHVPQRGPGPHGIHPPGAPGPHQHPDAHAARPGRAHQRPAGYRLRGPGRLQQEPASTGRRRGRPEHHRGRDSVRPGAGSRLHDRLLSETDLRNETPDDAARGQGIPPGDGRRLLRRFGGFLVQQGRRPRLPPLRSQRWQARHTHEFVLWMDGDKPTGGQARFHCGQGRVLASGGQ
mmetsp:Transcript_24048/g.52679  ORF Transcript_24048/g.52679 Transcript_24048/m.52679 type:complete len:416 (-) Transcript_24048:564-1811(-)